MIQFPPKVMSNRIIILLSILFISIHAVAQVRLQGSVVDFETSEPVPYATVKVVNSQQGVLCDAEGKFSISVPSKKSRIVVSAMGYDTEELNPSQFEKQNRIIQLKAIGISMNEVVVKPHKEKYSKKNNPAVDLIRKVSENRNITDPERHHYFNYDSYQTLALGFNNINPESNKNLLLRNFGFIRDYIDTSDVTGKPILTLTTKDKFSHNYYQKNPSKHREIVTYTNDSGIDDFLDKDNMRTMIEAVFQDIDIYDDNIKILRNTFVSPLSPIAPDFYKFYLTDTINIEGDSCIELSFVPRNSHSLGFTGKFYITQIGDNYFIKRLNMNVPTDINLNFVNRLYLKQEFKLSDDTTRLKVLDDMYAEMQLLPGTPEFYGRRTTTLGAHAFTEPRNSHEIFSTLGNVKYDVGSESPDSLLNFVRYTPINHGKKSVKDMVSALRANRAYAITEKVLKIAFTQYFPTAKESKFDLGPVNTLFSHNHIEGWRFRVGGMTTANLNPHIFTDGYLAYGTKDKKFKYEAGLTYCFEKRKYHTLEFPINSIRINYKYDVDMLGQHFEFANNDNVVMSFKRKEDYQITYRRHAGIEYKREWANNLSISVSATYTTQHATEYMPFVYVNGAQIPRYNEGGFNVTFRYAPGEKFYQTATERINIDKDVPIFSLSHFYAPSGAFGNLFEVNKTEIAFQKRFRLSLMGYVNTIFKGGHVWSTSAYPDLLIPNANLSYIIQPETFSLMNPMEFINDSYASAFITYHASGALFNYIPLINKLKLREVFAFNCLYGHLSKRNDPAYNENVFRFPEISNTKRMGSMPYMEISAGIENIFKVMRVDYVWRLSYRNSPDISRSGLRVAVHFTF